MRHSLSVRSDTIVLFVAHLDVPTPRHSLVFFLIESFHPIGPLPSSLPPIFPLRQAYPPTPTSRGNQDEGSREEGGGQRSEERTYLDLRHANIPLTSFNASAVPRWLIKTYDEGNVSFLARPAT